MTINGKSTDITREDLLIAGRKMGLKNSFCQRTIQEITTVVNQFENYAQEVKLNKNTTDYIKKVLTQNKI